MAWYVQCFFSHWILKPCHFFAPQGHPFYKMLRWRFCLLYRASISYLTKLPSTWFRSMAPKPQRWIHPFAGTLGRCLCVACFANPKCKGIELWFLQDEAKLSYTFDAFSRNARRMFSCLVKSHDESGQVQCRIMFPQNRWCRVLGTSSRNDGFMFGSLGSR